MSTSAQHQQLVARAAERLHGFYPDRSRIALEALVRDALDGAEALGVFVREDGGELQVCLVLASEA